MQSRRKRPSSLHSSGKKATDDVLGEAELARLKMHRAAINELVEKLQVDASFAFSETVKKQLEGTLEAFNEKTRSLSQSQLLQEMLHSSTQQVLDLDVEHGIEE